MYGKIETVLKKVVKMRGFYNELVKASTQDLKMRGINDYGFSIEQIEKSKIFKSVSKIEKMLVDIQKDSTDEHGFKASASFDKKGRGFSINIDIYDIDFKGQNKAPLVIIQVRSWVKATKNGYATVHKSYFLTGRNENKVAFAHPIPSPLLHRWIDKNKLGVAVKKVQEWIFNSTLDRINRNGDVALINSESPTAEEILSATELSSLTHDKHTLTGEKILRVGKKNYVLNGTLSHPQHPAVSLQGWARFRVARRWETWDFANATKD